MFCLISMSVFVCICVSVFCFISASVCCRQSIASIRRDRAIEELLHIGEKSLSRSSSTRREGGGTGETEQRATENDHGMQTLVLMLGRYMQPNFNIS